MKELSKKEVLELIGNNTPLKFSFCHDNSFYFETLTPKHSEEENLHTYGVEVYAESGATFHDFDTLENILFNNQLAEVKKLYNDRVHETIFFRRYKEQLN